MASSGMMTQDRKLRRGRRSVWVRLSEQWQLLLFLLPVVVYVLIFCYGPMAGLVIAFKNYKPHLGIFGSDWVGLKNFDRFLGMRKFRTLLGNTLTLSIYSLLMGFPLPIILALALNSCNGRRFTRVVQTVTYAPHFISTVVLVGMIVLFFNPQSGIIRIILKQAGLMDGYLNTLLTAEAFPHLYVWSDVWKNVGWSSIIYLGALTGVDPSLHEAAIVDGATKPQRIFHIDIPAILPTIIVLLILRSGDLMSVGYEKALMMQNSTNLSTSEIISTYVYKQGIKEGQYSFATAVDLFNSAVNFLLIVIANTLSRRLTESSLW